MTATTNFISFDFNKMLRFLAVLAFLAILAVSWEDAAKDQYDRMHDDDGASCAMHIDYLAEGK